MASRCRKIHHAAFDAHLIGIDPDYRLHVSEGPCLSHRMIDDPRANDPRPVEAPGAQCSSFSGSKEVIFDIARC
jgi:hypothetical protein